MKKLFLTFVGLIAMTVMFAQEAPLAKGEMQLNGGFGFSNHGLPVYVGLDYAVHKDITVGGELSFRHYNDNNGNNGVKNDFSIFGISANGNYHFNSLLNIPKNWDFYAGLNLGYYIWTASSNYNGSNNSGLGLGAQVGGRYYWNDKWAVNLEFGGGNVASGGKIGITYKL